MTTSTSSSSASFSTAPQHRFVSRNSSALSTHSSTASTATVARRTSQRRRSHRNSHQTPRAATPPPLPAALADDAVDEDLLSLDLELTDYEKLILTKYMREFEGDADGSVRLSLGDNDDNDSDPRTPTGPRQTQPDRPSGRTRTEPPDSRPVPDRFPVSEPLHTDRHSFPSRTRSAQLAAAAAASGACCATQVATKSSSPLSLPPSSSSSAAAAAASITNNLGVSGGGGGGVTALGVANSNVSGASSRHPPRSAMSNRRSMMRKSFSIWVGVTSCVWGLLLYLDKSFF